MSLRTLADRIKGRHKVPAGATHVLHHLPAEITEPPSQGPGWWELQTVADWQSGDHANFTPEMDGPRDADLITLAAFAERELGCVVTFDCWEFDLFAADGTTFISTEPAYYVIPAGGVR